MQFPAPLRCAPRPSCFRVHASHVQVSEKKKTRAKTQSKRAVETGTGRLTGRQATPTHQVIPVPGVPLPDRVKRVAHGAGNDTAPVAFAAGVPLEKTGEAGTRQELSEKSFSMSMRLSMLSLLGSCLIRRILACSHVGHASRTTRTRKHAQY